MMHYKFRGTGPCCSKSSSSIVESVERGQEGLNIIMQLIPGEPTSRHNSIGGSTRPSLKAARGSNDSISLAGINRIVDAYRTIVGTVEGEGMIEKSFLQCLVDRLSFKHRAEVVSVVLALFSTMIPKH